MMLAWSKFCMSKHVRRLGSRGGHSHDLARARPKHMRSAIDGERLSAFEARRAARPMMTKWAKFAMAA